ncbi:hypothetical protein BSNK01_22990 [Bacillaceae bacterium]
MDQPKIFTDEDLELIMSKWDGNIVIKQHGGKVNALEVSKDYKLSTCNPEGRSFVLKVKRLYKFLTFNTGKDKIILNVSVRPEQMPDFTNFCDALREVERTLENNV